VIVDVTVLMHLPHASVNTVAELFPEWDVLVLCVKYLSIFISSAKFGDEQHQN
jgi:hypothetical protein